MKKEAPMKFKKLLPKILVDIYMAATVLAQIAFFGDLKASQRLSAVGANSGFLSFALFLGEEPPLLLAWFSIFWVFVFPVLLIVFYILAWKEKYVPFCVVISIDALISFGWFASSLVQWDTYRMEAFSADGIISVVFAALLIFSIWQMEKAIEEDVTAG
jgi:hypothetical protein